MQASPAAIRGNLHFIRQGISLLEQLSTAVYTNGQAGRSPVGMQFRHVLDHYQCFLRGLPDGRINYDARLRETEVELRPDRAIAVARSIADALEMMDAGAAGHPLMVHMNSGDDGDTLDWQASTVGRELQFLSSHTVHHYALIKLLLEEQGIETGDDFGAAPSTLAYLRSGR